MGHDQHGEHHVNYFAIFIILCLCTAASAVADLINIHSRVLLIFIVMSIATAKALFVMMFFMHLKFEGRWKYVLLAPTIILAIGLPLALLPDIGVSYYTTVAPQKLEAAEHQAAGHSLPSAHHNEGH